MDYEVWDRWDMLQSHRDAPRSKSSGKSILALPVISATITSAGGGGGDVESESSESGEESNDEEDEKFTPVETVTSSAKARQNKSSRLKMRALDFLSDIQMDAEKEEGFFTLPSKKTVDDETAHNNAETENKEVSNEPLTAQHEQQQDLLEDNTPMGIRLRGTSKFHYVSKRVRMNSLSHVNSRSTSKGKHAQPSFEQGLLAQGLNASSRIYLSWNKAYPNMVLSVIKYDETVESKRRKKLRLSSVIMEMPRRRNEVPKILSDATWVQKRWGTSYAPYCNKDWAEASGDKIDPARAAMDEWWDRNYRPDVLDDSRIRQGKHRTVQSMDGYYLSVLPYTKKKALKAGLNEVFREQHPTLPAELTLSKIRNLKREVLEHVQSLGLELSTAALAITYFEKLVFKGVVGKANRKLVMSVCLLLAYKFNEPKRSNMATVKDLLDDIDRVQSLSPKQVLEAEFPVFGHLLFHLNAPKEHMVTHFSRLLKAIESTPTEYLGEDLAEFYFPDEQLVNGELSPTLSPVANTMQFQPRSTRHYKGKKR